jgi:hypothetical protein
MLLVLAAAIVLAATSAAREQASPPSLAGAWQQEGQSPMLLATKTYVAFFGVDSLPALSTYTIEGDRVTLQPVAAGRSFNDAILEDDLGIKAPKANATVVLDRFEAAGARIRFTAPDGITRTWRPLE